MSSLPSNGKWNVACIWFFSKVPLQFLGEAKGFKCNRPTQVIFLYVLHRVLLVPGFMARAHLQKQVYHDGLSGLAESNDLDSDMASLAD
jgi:hypothetical protein